MKHFLLLLILFLSACSQNIGNLSIVSTQPTNISNEYDSIGQIQGESKIKPNTLYPQASMRMINEAIQNALDISGADLITDATFELKNTFMIIFEANKLVVTGEGWVKKKEGIKREKEIIEYDPDTGEPIDIPIKQESPLFGKDVLYLKSGDFIRGKCDGKTGNYIIFQIEGKNKKYRLEKVESIEIDNKNYYYPFNLPITSTYKYQGLSPTTKSKLYPLAGTCVVIIWLIIDNFLESS